MSKIDLLLQFENKNISNPIKKRKGFFISIFYKINKIMFYGPVIVNELPELMVNGHII